VNKEKFNEIQTFLKIDSLSATFRRIVDMIHADVISKAVNGGDKQ
jgi:hypothetical protein